MSKKIAIYYGTMTGNSEALAREILDNAQDAGWDAAIYNLADVASADLATNAPNAIYIVSTWGDGEPPSDAINFFEDLAAASVDLSAAKHAVFGLGDSNYEQFCKFATDLDARLSELGSSAVLDVAKGDVSFELDFAKWKPKALAAFGE
ncbi:MAG: flavodoxin-like domain-containing protein [Puniceicoccales bacterium]|nr:flavodoxin-like domain-containing protein [Puniceicoccales bacterium]